MPFGRVSGVGRCIRWVVIDEGEEAVLGVNLGRPIVTNGDIVAYESDALFPITLGSTCLPAQSMSSA